MKRWAIVEDTAETLLLRVALVWTAPLTLITPALFSQPPPHRPGEEGESQEAPLSFLPLVDPVLPLQPGPFLAITARYHRCMRVPSKGALVRAKRLRRISTPSEDAIWELLRDRKLLGLKFRRQVPIGPYVADFYCYELRLVLEIDGSIHEEDSQIAHDRNRDANLEALGFRLLRFTNRDADEKPGISPRNHSSSLHTAKRLRTFFAVLPLLPADGGEAGRRGPG
jgi:very-short-patch-repair endonuclease